MKTDETTRLEKLQAEMDEAKTALLLDCGTPCRGRLYPYERGKHRYWKWERCENGRRVQRTVGVDDMEALAAGIADRKQLEERLKRYYSTCEEYVRAKVKAEKEEEAAAQKKRGSSTVRKKSGGRH